MSAKLIPVSTTILPESKQSSRDFYKFILVSTTILPERNLVEISRKQAVF